MNIEIFSNDEEKKWDEFLAGFPDHTFFHLYSWFKVLTDTYHHQLLILAAKNDSKQLIGCFPLFFIKHPFIGAKLISIPYQTAVGGPISEDPETIDALLKSAIELGLELNVNYIEIRGPGSENCYTHAGFQRNEVPASLTHANLSDIHLKNIRKNHQRDIKKALKNHINIIDDNSIQEWKIFYELFEQQQRRYAAPGFGWKFFCLLHERLRHKVMIRLAWVDNKCIGGILLFHHNKTVYYKQGVLADEYKKYGAGKLMMWDSMVWAKEKGYEIFNFGMSLNSNHSLVSYKEGFIGITVPVENYIYPVKGRPPKIEDLDTNYKIAKWVWRNMPLFTTKRLGTLMSRWYC